MKTIRTIEIGRLKKGTSDPSFRIKPRRKFSSSMGLILGPMLDENLRRGLILNEGSVIPFFNRPISIILIVFILMTLFSRNQFLKQSLARVKNLIFSGARNPK